MNEDALRRRIRVIIESIISGEENVDLDNEEEIEEMTTCASIGAMGYQLPLGMSPLRSKKKGKGNKKKTSVVR